MTQDVSKVENGPLTQLYSRGLTDSGSAITTVLASSVFTSLIYSVLLTSGVVVMLHTIKLRLLISNFVGLRVHGRSEPTILGFNQDEMRPA